MYAPTHTHYQSQAVETAGAAQLVLMLYDGALAAVTRSEQALRDIRAPGQIETANRELRRAQDIVTELTVTLDRERGGQVAAGLATLYDFCLDRLITANVRKDPAGLADARSVLGSLRETWAASCVHGPAPVAG